MKPFKVLHLIRTMNPEAGGPPEVVSQLVRASLNMGKDVEIACQDCPAEPFLQRLPCPVHALGSTNYKYGYSRKLLEWLRQNISRFDGLVIHGIWQYVDLAGRRAAVGHVPYIIFVHGALDPWFKQHYPLKHIKKYLYWPFQYRVLRQAGAVLFTGKQERDLAATSFRPNRWKDQIVPLGTLLPPGDRDTRIESFYSLAPALRGRRYLLFLGRIHEKKGCDLLIEAFAWFAPEYPDVDLVIAGPDQVGLQPKLRQLAEDAGIGSRVHWTGMITGDAKYGAYHACEAFILPSHQENFGIAVTEALACGKPVLISNKVEIWETIEQCGAGLVEEDTLEGTDQLLRKWFLMGPADRMAMAERSISCFEKHFSIKNAVEAIEKIFLESK